MAIKPQNYGPGRLEDSVHDDLGVLPQHQYISTLVGIKPQNRDPLVAINPQNRDIVAIKSHNCGPGRLGDSVHDDIGVLPQHLEPRTS